MEDMYRKTLQMIKELPKIPSQKEWNKIAEENCLLSCTTLQYVEGKGFHKLCKEIRETS